jgi:hypothetical protein
MVEFSREELKASFNKRIALWDSDNLGKGGPSSGRFE